MHTCFWFHSFRPSLSSTNFRNVPLPSLVIGFESISMGWLAWVFVCIWFPIPGTMLVVHAFSPTWGRVGLFWYSWFRVVFRVLPLCCEGWCFRFWFWWANSYNSYHCGTYHWGNDFSLWIRLFIWPFWTSKAFSRRKTQLNHLQKGAHADRSNQSKGFIFGIYRSCP